MSSGMGATGAVGRCFSLFKQYQQCLVSSDPKECLLVRDDYFECLHNYNRNKRAATIEEHMRQQKAAAKNEA